MSDLSRLYRLAVISRIAEMRAALDGTGDHARDLHVLRTVAHSLRGSGGTYGFPEVSTAAGAVEDAPAADVEARARELLIVLDELVAGGPKPVRILVVDDDPEIRLILTTVLDVDNREIHTAEDGATADAALAGEPYSLVILDLLLPDADGADILRRVRADHRYDALPVLVLSAKTNILTRQQCESLGATAFFEKPFNPEAVAAAVAAQLLRTADPEAGSA